MAKAKANPHHRTRDMMFLGFMAVFMKLDHLSSHSVWYWVFVAIMAMLSVHILTTEDDDGTED